MKSLVTVGIPTFNRPELLGRALRSVARQDYPNIEVLIADNATPGAPNRRIVESYARDIPHLSYIKHESSLGPRGNFMFLLECARGRYFMWLADDDEISPNYISSLVDVLEKHPTASSAAGHWVLMTNEQDGRVMPTSNYPQRFALARALRYIWRSDDAFFYALHRTDVLRQASFRGYWRPNRRVLSNWAFVYLLDVVLRGQVLLAGDTSVQFVNHDYTQKSYLISCGRVARLLSRALLRVNVHYLYWEKCAQRLSPFAMPAVIATSLIALFRDGGIFVLRRASRIV